MGTKPFSRIVVPFILESYRDPVLVESPQLLYQAVVEFFCPFSFQKLDDSGSPVEEFGSITPATVRCVSEGDTFGIARIPGILGGARFLGCSFEGERWKWRSGLHSD